MKESKFNIYLVLKTTFLIIGVISVFGKKYFLQYFSKSFISAFSMIILASIFIIGGAENYKRGNIRDAKLFFMIAAGIGILATFNFIF